MRNEKSIVSVLEVTFTAFMDPLLVYSGTTPCNHIPCDYTLLPFNGLVYMFHNVVMNFNVPLVTGLYSHKLQAILLVNFNKL